MEIINRAASVHGPCQLLFSDKNTNTIVDYFISIITVALVGGRLPLDERITNQEKANLTAAACLPAEAKVAGPDPEIRRCALRHLMTEGQAVWDFNEERMILTVTFPFRFHCYWEHSRW